MERRIHAACMRAALVLVFIAVSRAYLHASNPETVGAFTVTIECRLGTGSLVVAPSTVYVPEQEYVSNEEDVYFVATGKCNGELHPVTWDSPEWSSILDHYELDPTGGSDGVIWVRGSLKNGSANTYDVEATSGDATASVQLYVFDLDLDVYLPPGIVVPETDHDSDTDEDEEDIGSFTVANLNDSDSANGSDHDDRSVTGEKDLMKLVLNVPAPNPVSWKVKIKFDTSEGGCHVWPDSTKTGDEITDFEVSIGDLPKTWYVEATSATLLQGIKISYHFKHQSYDAWLLGDRVSATAIWATCAKVVSSNLTATQVDAQFSTPEWNEDDALYPYIMVHYDTNGTGTNTRWPDNNVIVLQFSVAPFLIASVPEKYGDGTTYARPLFDITRQIEHFAYMWPSATGATVEDPPQPVFTHKHFPSDDELPNDDSEPDQDETDQPTFLGVMWSADAPGPGPADGGMRAMRFNAKEFVRVAFDGNNPSGNAVAGSRCSPKQEWYSKRTNGLVTSPTEIGTGNFTFAREALHTQVNKTSPTSPLTMNHGIRYHGIMRGLELAQNAGTNAGTITLRLLADSTVIDSRNDVKLVGSASSLVGDVVAYAGDDAGGNSTGVCYFASRMNGHIVGRVATSGDASVSIRHEIGTTGEISPGISVTGSEYQMPAPDTINMTLGAITFVSAEDGGVDAEDSLGGNQTVDVQLIKDDESFAGDDVLHDFSATAAKELVDDVTAGTVTAFQYAMVKFDFDNARIASKANGHIIGPDGDSGEQNAEIAYKVGTNISSSRSATGPVYSKPAPVVSATTIPIDDDVTVTMDSIYIEATGSAGSEEFEVRVVDSDDMFDDLLDAIDASITRPNGCFAGALIGPANPAVEGTLTNPSPGGVVKGPDGNSGEQEAEIVYEIGSSSDNSPSVSVTANEP